MLYIPISETNYIIKVIELHYFHTILTVYGFQFVEVFQYIYLFIPLVTCLLPFLFEAAQHLSPDFPYFVSSPVQILHVLAATLPTSRILALIVSNVNKFQ